MKHIELNIGKACNNKCIFCMSGDSDPEMLNMVNIDYIKKRLKEYSKKGYDSVGYLGGDISIHPKILKIISYSKELGFKEISIITNGMLFSKYDFAFNILDSGATRINFSIHSHLSEIEDYITKIPGGLKKKLKAIDNFNYLKCNGFLKNNLSINIVLNKINLKNIVETVLYYYKIKGIFDIRINFIWLSDFNGLMKGWEELSISYTEVMPYLKKLIYISMKYGIRITFDAVPPCIFHKISYPNGEKLVKNFVGEQFDIINEIEHVNTFKKEENFNWKEKKRNILKTKFEQCEKCKYYNLCEGVWNEYADIYGGDEFSPIY